jgi:phosphocarrier protein
MSNHTKIIEINRVAVQFQSSIVLRFDNKNIDVKSILGLFTTLTESTVYDLEIRGKDAEAAKTAIVSAFEAQSIKLGNVIAEAE